MPDRNWVTGRWRIDDPGSCKKFLNFAPYVVTFYRISGFQWYKIWKLKRKSDFSTWLRFWSIKSPMGTKSKSARKKHFFVGVYGIFLPVKTRDSVERCYVGRKIRKIANFLYDSLIPGRNISEFQGIAKVILWEALYICNAKTGKYTIFPQLFAKVERPSPYR